MWIYIYISIMPKCLWYKVFVIYWKTYISCQSVCNIVHMPSCCDVIPCGLMWCFFNPWWPGDILRDPERPWGTLRNRVRDLRDLEETWETVWTNLKPCEGTWETVFEKELEKPWENLKTVRELERLYMRDLKGTSWNQWVMVLLKDSGICWKIAVCWKQISKTIGVIRMVLPIFKVERSFTPISIVK